MISILHYTLMITYSHSHLLHFKGSSNSNSVTQILFSKYKLLTHKYNCYQHNRKQYGETYKESLLHKLEMIALV